MPASSTDSLGHIEGTIKASLTKGGQSTQNIDNLLIAAASAKKVLQQKIDFTPAEKSSTFMLESLRTKYIPLNGSIVACDEPVVNISSKSKDKEMNGPKNAGDGMPAPTVVLFPRDKVAMDWTQSRRVGVGLVNLGNTCFLNSILQCLTYTAPLTNYIYQNNHASHCKIAGFCMMCELGRHIRRALDANNGYPIRPQAILQKLRVIVKHMHVGRQEDAHEFLRFVIDAMQKSCLHGYNKLDRFSKETTVVNQIFGGFLRSQVVCLRCKERSNTYDPFLDICVDIKNVPSIQRAFDKYVMPETLEGDNAYNCVKCKQKVSAHKRFTIHRAPNVLTIQLKRFDFHRNQGGKVTKHISYPERLDLRPYMSQRQGEPVYYQLYAATVHAGHSLGGGHYYCYVKASNKQWYCMNDQMVQPVNIQRVLQSEVYLLFYAKITVKPSPPSNNKQPMVVPKLVSSQQHNQPSLISSTTIGAKGDIGQPIPRKPIGPAIIPANSPKVIRPSVLPTTVPLPGQRDKIAFGIKSLSISKPGTGSSIPPVQGPKPKPEAALGAPPTTEKTDTSPVEQKPLLSPKKESPKKELPGLLPEKKESVSNAQNSPPRHKSPEKLSSLFPLTTPHKQLPIAPKLEPPPKPEKEKGTLLKHEKEKGPPPKLENEKGPPLKPEKETSNFKKLEETANLPKPEEKGNSLRLEKEKSSSVKHDKCTSDASSQSGSDTKEGDKKKLVGIRIVRSGDRLLSQTLDDEDAEMIINKTKRLVPYNSDESSDSETESYMCPARKSPKVEYIDMPILDQRLNATLTVPGAYKPLNEGPNPLGYKKDRSETPSPSKLSRTNLLKRTADSCNLINAAGSNKAVTSLHVNATSLWDIFDQESQISPSVASGSSTGSVNSTTEWCVTSDGRRTPVVPEAQCVGWKVTPSPSIADKRTVDGECDTSLKLTIKKQVCIEPPRTLFSHKKSPDSGMSRGSSAEPANNGHGTPEWKASSTSSQDTNKDSGYASSALVNGDSDEYVHSKKHSKKNKKHKKHKEKKHKKHKKHKHDDTVPLLESADDSLNMTGKSLSSDSEQDDRPERKTSDEELVWVEKTKESIERDRKEATPKKEAVVQHWDHHIKDGYKRRHDDTDGESTKSRTAAWDGSRSSSSSVVSELTGQSSRGFGGSVSTWEGGRSALDLEAERDRQKEKKRKWTEDYEEELDRGKAKKVKAYPGEKAHLSSPYSGNVFQKLQDNRNKDKNRSCLHVAHKNHRFHPFARSLVRFGPSASCEIQLSAPAASLPDIGCNLHDRPVTYPIPTLHDHTYAHPSHTLHLCPSVSTCGKTIWLQ